MSDTVYTVGHSTHSIEKFIALLERHGITALCDVRSSPYSRLNPQFNREPLRNVLRDHGVAYVFLGKELGARTSDPSCYVEGKVQYERLAKTSQFEAGLERVQEGMRTHKVGLMCAEKDPLDCHRTILVTRNLVARGISAQHILEDGNLESHDQALSRLLRQLKLPEADMFRSREDWIDEAYAIQGERIAYEVPSIDTEAGPMIKDSAA
jgi:uncharacterized protein (DUF488 family)